MLWHARRISVLMFSFAACAAAKGSADSPQMPFAFAANHGQTAPEVRYTGTGPRFKAWFKDRGVILQQGSAAIALAFVAGAVPVISPEEPLGAQANYLHGNDQRHWQKNVPLYGSIRYTGVWPGVDIRYRSGPDQVEAEYVVAAGASPDRIRLRFDGTASIEPDGSLRVRGDTGLFVENKPILYQDADGTRRTVSGAFQRYRDGTVGFRVGEWNRSQPLIIDPTILFSGYFGGSSQDSITAVAFNASRNTIVAGWTSSSDLPTTIGARKSSGGGVDAFVAGFSAAGGHLLFCTYLGGSGDDRAFGLALDTAQNIYLTGQTSSTNFPLVSPLQSRLSGSRDAFVAKLNPAGTSFLYSTYLGGSGVDVGYAIAVDGGGSAVVFGDTTSTNLAVTAGAVQSHSGGAQDTFVAKLVPAGNTLAFLTYFGGSGLDHGAAVALDAFGDIFLGGYTWSTNFPVQSAPQGVSGGGQDGFLTKMQPNGHQLFFSTYLGGSGGSVGAPEEVNAMAIDLLSNVIVAGTTSSSNFPVTVGALQTIFGGETDGFVTRYSGSGVLLNSTYVGGALNDSIAAIALDYHGDVYITGSTASLDFPVKRALQPVPAGNANAFVVKLSNTLASVVFGTYLGGNGNDAGQAIAVDVYTSILVAGQTNSSNFPAAGSTLASHPQAVVSAFLTKIAPSWNILVAHSGFGFMLFDNDIWRINAPSQESLFGLPTDIPIVGDWDGSGDFRLGVFRNGTWYLDVANHRTLDGSAKVVTFGQAGDIPVLGDWTGAGHITLGLFRSGTFILDLSGHLSGVSTGQSDATFSFGQAGDLPVAGDWSGSGTTKVGIFRNGLWLVDYSGSRVFSSAISYTYGQAGDIPLTGDWDSSGGTKIGVYRGGNWLLDYDGDHVFTIPYLNEMVLVYGGPGFTPLIF